MTTELKVTYKEACETIANAFNGDGRCDTKLTWEDIWSLDDSLAIKGLHWFNYLYDIAKQGPDMLTGLLITDEFYAKLFCKKLKQKERRS